MHRQLAPALLCAALVVSGCGDDKGTSPAPPSPEQGLVGRWEPVVNIVGHHWTFRTIDSGSLLLHSGFLHDSLPFAYAAAGGTLRIVLPDTTWVGSYHMVSPDLVELKLGGMTYAMARVDTFDLD